MWKLNGLLAAWRAMFAFRTFAEIREERRETDTSPIPLCASHFAPLGRLKIWYNIKWAISPWRIVHLNSLRPRKEDEICLNKSLNTILTHRANC